jgi:predicted enzyme related to lactoylglutathione lyase
MSIIKVHKPGTFCWTDLSTTSTGEAKRFYSEILGWTYDEVPMGPGQTYSMAKKGGQEVGAIGGQSPDDKKRGAPPHWNNYVAVKSAAETAARAERLGGKLLAPAFDVMDAGRMAVLQDPQGAILSIWEPKNHQGAQLLMEPGSMCWNELLTRDLDAAGRFYGELFGWKTKTDDKMDYTLFMLDDQHVAGTMAIRPEWGPMAPGWMVYFEIADVDRAAAEAGRRGAKVLVPPKDIPSVGRFTTMMDPQGAAVSLIQSVRK